MFGICGKQEAEYIAWSFRMSRSARTFVPSSSSQNSGFRIVCVCCVCVCVVFVLVLCLAVFCVFVCLCGPCVGVFVCAGVWVVVGGRACVVCCAVVWVLFGGVVGCGVVGCGVVGLLLCVWIFTGRRRHTGLGLGAESTCSDARRIAFPPPLSSHSCCMPPCRSRWCCPSPFGESAARVSVRLRRVA